MAEEKQNNLPTAQDSTLLSQYTSDLTTAKAGVASAQTKLNNDTKTRDNFKKVGTDWVKLSSSTSTDLTGHHVTITTTQTTQSAGKQSKKTWHYTEVFNN